MVEKDLKIQSKTHQLVIEAIKTVPIDPIQTEIRLCAHGLKLHLNNKEDEVKEYLTKCAKYGVIPYSSSCMESYCDPVKFSLVSSFDKKGPVLDGILQNFKPSTIGIKFDAKHFPLLKDCILDGLLGKKYQIDYATLVLSTYHSSQHYEEGDYADTQVLSFNGNDLELRMGSDENIRSEHKKMIFDWFDGLSKKYKQKD